MLTIRRAGDSCCSFQALFGHCSQKSIFVEMWLRQDDEQRRMFFDKPFLNVTNKNIYSYATHILPKVL